MIVTAASRLDKQVTDYNLVSILNLKLINFSIYAAVQSRNMKFDQLTREFPSNHEPNSFMQPIRCHLELKTDPEAKD
jgi:hypothetical protein